MVGAFHSLCDALCNYVVLVVPHIEDTYTVHVDASRKGLGSSLLVIRNGEELPVSFFSRQLRGAESRYSATELEAGARGGSSSLAPLPVWDTIYSSDGSQSIVLLDVIKPP